MGIKTRPYRDYEHGTFEEEWGAHEDASEWWYATGYQNVNPHYNN